MKYIFWDIDGTLLLTGGAGSYAMEEAVRAYYSLRAFSFATSLAGRTNAEIVREAITEITGQFDAAAAAAIMASYNRELKAALPRYKGRVMKNVARNLRHFAALNSRYANCLLTGNDETGATLKLDYYQLKEYFDFECSVFGENIDERSELAREALRRLRLHNPSVSAASLIFIGDTPNDAACAAAVGAPCLIVLDGSSYQEADFAAAPPWQILSSLPADPLDLQKLFDAL